MNLIKKLGIYAGILGSMALSGNSLAQNSLEDTVDTSKKEKVLLIGTDKDHSKNNWETPSSEPLEEVLRNKGCSVEFYSSESGKRFFHILDSLKSEGKSFDDIFIGGHGVPSIIGHIRLPRYEGKLDSNYHNLVKDGDIYLSSCFAGKKCGEYEENGIPKEGPSNAEYFAWLFRKGVWASEKGFMGFNMKMKKGELNVTSITVDKSFRKEGFSKDYIGGLINPFKTGIYEDGSGNYLYLKKHKQGNIDFFKGYRKVDSEGEFFYHKGEQVKEPKNFNPEKVFHMGHKMDWSKYPKPEEKPKYSK